MCPISIYIYFVCQRIFEFNILKIASSSVFFLYTSSHNLSHFKWAHGDYGGGLVARLCPTLVTPWTVARQAPLSMGSLYPHPFPLLRGPSLPYLLPYNSNDSFLPHHMTCGILVPRPGIEPVAPAVEARCPNHWTAREVPSNYSFLMTEAVLFTAPTPLFSALFIIHLQEPCSLHTLTSPTCTPAQNIHCGLFDKKECQFSVSRLSHSTVFCDNVPSHPVLWPWFLFDGGSAGSRPLALHLRGDPPLGQWSHGDAVLHVRRCLRSSWAGATLRTTSGTTWRTFTWNLALRTRWWSSCSRMPTWPRRVSWSSSTTCSPQVPGRWSHMGFAGLCGSAFSGGCLISVTS